jgi:hypothetical protein
LPEAAVLEVLVLVWLVEEEVALVDIGQELVCP